MKSISIGLIGIALSVWICAIINVEYLNNQVYEVCCFITAMLSIFVFCMFIIYCEDIDKKIDAFISFYLEG